MGHEGVGNFLNPTSVAIVGASSREGSWAYRVRTNLQRFGFGGPVFLVNPKYEQLWGEPCYPSLTALPQTPDHVAIMVPAPLVAMSLQEAKEAGSRSATIYTSGFGEGGSAEGMALREELVRVIRESGMAVSGPNCLGGISARSSLVTMPEDRIRSIRRGPVAIVGQSGGVVMAINRSLNDRGIDVGYLVTSGNELGLTLADYVDYFADEEDTQVVAAFVEAIKDRDRFLQSCRRMQAAGKILVTLKVGGSKASRQAAMAHTGSLAGSLDAFDAVTRAVGVLRVDTLDEMIELCEFYTHARHPRGPGVAAITFSGGLKGLLLESAERQGLPLADLSQATTDRLSRVLGVGTSLGNPVDSGYAGLTDGDVYEECVKALLDDPGVDLVMAQEELLREPGRSGKEANLERLELLARSSPKPIAMVSMVSHNVTDYGRTLRERFPHLPFLQEADKAVRTVKYAIARSETGAEGFVAARPADTDLAERAMQILRAGAKPGEATVGEFRSKQLLGLYGIASPKERIVQNEDEALRAADELGYPVVLKVSSLEIVHKSDMGGVFVGVKDATQLRAAFADLMHNVETYRRRLQKPLAVDGILVAQQVYGGLELVLGVHKDPEMGPVVMVGRGGVELELAPDVAFGAVPMSEAEAARVLGRTRVSRLLEGYRGAGEYDRGAVVRALVAISRLAFDVQGAIREIDVNPLLVLKSGALALDATVVLE